MEGVVEAITTSMVVKTLDLMTNDVPTPTLNEFLDPIMDEEKGSTVDMPRVPGLV